MKRILTATLLAALAVVLTACPQPAEPPPPLTLTWTRVLETPDRRLQTGYAANDNYVYVAAEELPLDLNYEEKWLSLWRLDGEGNVVGPVRYPDEAAVSELAAAGMGCPQPLDPRISLDKAGRLYVATVIRNQIAQQDGCDTWDGAWANKTWSVYPIFDDSLHRIALGYLKSLDGDDDTYSATATRLVGSDAFAHLSGIYVADMRTPSTAAIGGSLEADGTVVAAVNNPAPSSWINKFLFPFPNSGWLETQSALSDSAGFTERLVRFDAAGNEVWSLVTARESFPPTQDAVGVAGSETVFVSGMVYDGDAYAGVEPPESAQERAHFVARIDGGELKWIRWISAESDNWLYPNHYADVAVAYDPEYGEVYAAMNDVVMALDPESGETKWITDIIEFAPSSENPDEDWYFTYQPQNFDGLYVVDGGLIAMSTSWWDTDGHGNATETSRYRPLVLRLDRRY